MNPPIKPRQGQVWAFGGANGRRDIIKSVSRGAVGSWKMVDGKLTPANRATAMWVKWESRNATITVSALWKDWVFIA